MTSYDLTNKQKQLLILLIKSLKAKKITEPIIPEINAESCSIEGIDEKFDRNFIWDMEVLCDAKFMECTYSRYSSQGNRIYTITQTGYKAVANNFAIPEEPEIAQDDRKMLHGEINIEKIQAMWFDNIAEIHQIVDDSHLLKRIISSITNQLLNVIEPEISAFKLATYKRAIQDLEEEITAGEPSPTKLQRLFNTLAFMEDIGSSISLATKAWPYIYPMLIIANQKISP